MATSVNRMWEGEKAQVVVDGKWVVTSRFLVVGPSSSSDAMSAIDDTTSLAVPHVGDASPDNPALICMDVDVRWVDQSPGGNVWEITASYESPQFDWTSAPPTQWEWDESVRSSEAGADRNGKPFLNSVGDPLVGSFPDESFDAVLHVWTTAAVFNVTLAQQVRGAVNSTPLLLFGAGTVGEQQMRLTSYKPEHRFTQGVSVPYFRIYHRFEFREGYRPFQPRAVDAGFNAWSSGARLPIYPVGGKSPTQVPVLLNGAGIPVQSSFCVRKSDDSAEQTISAPPSVPANFTIDPGSLSSDGRVLVWSLVKTYNFVGFIPGVM